MPFIPEINRATFDDGGRNAGQCLWWAIGSTLQERGGYAGFGPRARSLARGVQKAIADYIEGLTDEQWEQLVHGESKQWTRKAYVKRLRYSEGFVGQQHWGGLFDIQVAVYWLAHVTDGRGHVTSCIITYDDRAKSLTKFALEEGDKVKMRLRFDASELTDLDLVLYNRGNSHWLPTKVVPGE